MSAESFGWWVGVVSGLVGIAAAVHQWGLEKALRTTAILSLTIACCLLAWRLVTSMQTDVQPLRPASVQQPAAVVEPAQVVQSAPAAPPAGVVARDGIPKIGNVLEFPDEMRQQVRWEGKTLVFPAIPPFTRVAVTDGDSRRYAVRRGTDMILKTEAASGGYYLVSIMGDAVKPSREYPWPPR